MGQFYRLCRQKISASEVSRAGDWERGKGVTLPSPDLSSLRFARRDFWLFWFFLPPISLTAEPGPRLKDLKPKLNTENLKGVKIGKT